MPVNNLSTSEIPAFEFVDKSCLKRNVASKQQYNSGAVSVAKLSKNGHGIYVKIQK